MFNLFSQNKEYLSCEWLEYGIHFDMQGLFHCCQYWHNNANNIPVSKVSEQNKYDFKDFIYKKKKIKKEQRKGIINERCRGCLLLKKQAWNKSLKINNMAISSFSKCNSDCIYCSTHRNKKYYNSLPDIPIMDFLNNLDKKNMLGDDIHIEFGGGEPTIADEFEDIINFFIAKSKKTIKIHTSGIKYSRGIERLLKQDKCELIISPDCGTSELYQKIKNTDKFKEVWENIKRYVQAQNLNKKQVFAKYIIIPGINDNNGEIISFFNQIIKAGVNNVLADIESSYYKNNSNNIEKTKEIFSVFKFMKEYSEKNNLSFNYNMQAVVAIEKYHSLFDSVMGY